ncbi:hypothetical protein F4823DRAFT_548756 [Ustulina deusta]|nr:hypothetical protein F4823DRAFT_548756 [Ustulina deusta]
MTHAPPRGSRVEIPLPSKPRDYRPGDGPALAPVRLMLDHDTGAFIVEKRVRPGKPINGELKLELYYIVGWPDLPTARVAVLATKILDYVSPRTLEDWEYKSSLEKDEEEKRVAAEKRKQEERAKTRVAATSGTETRMSTPVTPGQKRRGRPSKAEVLARQLAEQASFGEDELASVPLPPARTSGPSLSTPKKRLAQVSTDLEDLEETDVNEAISKQLQGGSGRDSDSQTAGDLDEPDRLDTEDGFSSLNPFLPSPSSRGYAEFLVPNLPSSAPNDPTRSTPLFPIFLHSKKPPARQQKTQLTTPVPVPSYPRQSWKIKPPVPLGKTITPVPAPSFPFGGVRLRGQTRVVTVTPVPAPPCPVPKPKPLKRPHEPKCTPVPPPVNSITSNVSQGLIFEPAPKKARKATSTPIPPPTISTASEKPKRVACTPIPPPPPFASDRAAGLQKRNSFAPAGQKRHTSAGAAGTVEHDDGPHTPSKSATPTARTSSSRKRPKPKEDQEWEVKQLEGDKVLETSGKLDRFFKVRWVGNWPADQNPTWEPEENISQVLVQKYLKDKATKISRHGSSPRKIKRPIPTFTKKYSSVADAFEGDANDVPGPSSSLLGDLQVEEEGDDEDDDAAELFQVTEQTRANTPYQKPRIDPELVRELVASFF